MNITVEKIVEEAVSLRAGERATMVDKLLSSLDTPDPIIDNLGKEEVEDRILAAKRGAMEIISAEEVFEKYKNKNP